MVAGQVVVEMLLALPFLDKKELVRVEDIGEQLVPPASLLVPDQRNDPLDFFNKPGSFTGMNPALCVDNNNSGPPSGSCTASFGCSGILAC